MSIIIKGPTKESNEIELARDAYQLGYKVGTKEQSERIAELEAEVERLADIGLRALCLTRDYVGYEVLPIIDGWEWYEAAKVFVAVNPDGEWSQQLGMRITEALKGADNANG